MTITDILKKALQSRMNTTGTIFSHEFQEMVEYGKRFEKLHTAESYSRAFRKLREEGTVKVEQFRRGRQNGYRILEVR